MKANTAKQALHGVSSGWTEANADDARWQALRFGLSQLSLSQLRRLLGWLLSGKPVALDTFNYDAERQLWCPLAIGLQVPEIVAELGAPLTNERAKALIREVGQSNCSGFSLNPLSGVPGAFFRSQRSADITEMCRFLLADAERNEDHFAGVR